MAAILFLTLDVSGQIGTNISSLPYSTTITNQDEFIQQFKDVSAATGYRTRRIAASNVLDYINHNLRGDGQFLTNLDSSIVIAGANVTVVTNTAVGTGRKSYTVSAAVGTNDLTIFSTNIIPSAVKTSEQSISVVSTNMVNISGMSVTLGTGTYKMECVLFTTNYPPGGVGGSDAFLFNLEGGSATVSTARFTGYAAQSGVGTATAITGLGGGSLTNLSQVIPQSARLQDDQSYVIVGVITVSGGGTIIPKVRCEAGGSVAGYMGVQKNSYIMFIKL